MPTSTVVSRGYLAPRAVDGVRGRVRATFARCAYVTLDGGQMLVLHGDGHDHTPTSLCPAIWPPPSSAVAVGDPVVGRAGHLKIGDLVLDVRGARVWCPAPAPAPVPAMSIAELGTIHRLLLWSADRRTGELVPALERALARRDRERVARCVAALVGRGPGLTPSGDDALVGLLATLHRLAPWAGEGSPGPPPYRLAPGGERAATELLRTAIAAHLHRTADISGHYLRLALAGHFGERLIALTDALAAGTQDEAETAAAAVIATGATSGADALLGVLSGARLVAATGAANQAVAA